MTPLSPIARNVIFTCALILPAAAASAAYPFKNRELGTMFNIIAAAIGVFAISAIGTVLFLYR
jgi:hypothetical protein